MDFTKEAERQSAFSSLNSFSISTDSKQVESEVLPEMQEKLKILMDGIDESIAENIAIENEMSDILKELGLDFKCLPNDIQKALNKVCDILKTEELSDMNLSTLEIHMNRKELEFKKKVRVEAEFNVHYQEAFKKYKRMEEKLESTKSSVDSLESKIYSLKENHSNEESERLLNLTKLNTYKDKVVAMEKQLEDLQVGEAHPDEIFKTSAICMEKIAELTALNKYLSKYRDLPPNLLQAKAALESKKKELEKLDRMFMERFA